MKAKINLTLLLLLATIYSYGQFDSYMLRDYKNPDYKRKSLDVNFNSSGGATKNTNQTNSTLKGNLGFSFNQIRNSRKVQESTNLTLNTDAMTNRIDSVDRQKSRNLGVNLSFKQEAHYYMWGKNFVEISPDIAIGYDNEKNKNNATNNLYQYNKDFSNQTKIDLGLGYGRIENVTDARQAIYILNDLYDKGYLKRILTNEEIDNFARQIAIIKNKRQYDAREKAINEITNINKYLIEQELVDENNTAEYFLTLNDNWQYGDKDQRLSGSRFKYGVTPSFRFHDNNTSFEEDSYSAKKTVDTRWGGGVYIDFTNEKPINLKWQRSFKIGARSELYRWRMRECNELLTQSYITFAMGCYVSTRTYIESKITENLFWNRTPKTNKLSKENSLTNNTKLSLNGYYYISAQVRLFGELNLSYDFKRVMEKNSNWHDKYPANQFQLGLEFAIF